MAFACVRGPGHPDQACDHVARALVDEYVRRDPEAVTRIQVSGGQGTLFVNGEVRSVADFDAVPIIKQALGDVDPALMLEPFVSIERLRPPEALPSSEAVNVFGYATDENALGLPRVMFEAKRLANEIERLRQEDGDWFWCGADYDVSVHLGGRRPLAIIRLCHTPQMTVEDMRQRASSALSLVAPDMELRLNPAGADQREGLAGRCGSSGRGLQSGAGFHPRHPLNKGVEMAQSAANGLVRDGHGHSVWVELAFGPMEKKPFFIRARNEKGQDLSTLLDPDRLTL